MKFEATDIPNVKFELHRVRGTMKNKKKHILSMRINEMLLIQVGAINYSSFS